MWRNGWSRRATPAEGRCRVTPGMSYALEEAHPEVSQDGIDRLTAHDERTVPRGTERKEQRKLRPTTAESPTTRSEVRRLDWNAKAPAFTINATPLATRVTT